MLQMFNICSKEKIQVGQRPRGHFGGLIPALVSGLPRHTQLHKQIATGYLHNYHDKSIPYGGLVTSAQKPKTIKVKQ